MSSLIFNIEEHQVLVATDTLAVLPDSGKPFKYTTKAFVLPHLRLIIAGTGIAGFLSRWFVRINDQFLVAGIDSLDHHAPGDLPAIWAGFKHELAIPDSMQTSIFHFGISENTGLLHSFAYRSNNNFRSEPLGPGIYARPEVAIPDSYNLPHDLKKIMDDQRNMESSKPKDKRVYIGGEIEIHQLSKEGFCIYTLDRFEDYEENEKAMFENLASSNQS